MRLADQVGMPWRYFPAQALDGQYGPVDEWSQQQVCWGVVAKVLAFLGLESLGLVIAGVRDVS